ERHVRRTASAACRAMLSRVIDENAAHDAARDAEEMRPVAPVAMFERHEPKVGLVRKRRRLQGVIRAFVTQLRSREAPQFRVDERDEALQRALVAAPARAEQRGDCSRIGWWW